MTTTTTTGGRGDAAAAAAAAAVVVALVDGETPAASAVRIGMTKEWEDAS